MLCLLISLLSEDSQLTGFDKHFKMSVTEKSAHELRDITESFFFMGRVDGILRIYSLLVSQEEAQNMNVILDTMAGLKYKFGPKNSSSV